MRLTILGNNGPYPEKDGACSGYLLEFKNSKVLLDCGSGVLSKLQNYCRIEDLTHIILSHLHYDHIADMMVLKYAIEGKRKRGENLQKIQLILPNEPIDEFNKITFKDLFNVNVINNDFNTEIEGIRLSFQKMSHPITCYGVKFTNGEKTFIYSGDTALKDFPYSFIENCTVFLCDAGLLSKDKKSEDVPHLTAREAGIISNKAGVKRLLLTHFWPEDNKKEHLKEAQEYFPAVELAKRENTYQI